MKRFLLTATAIAALMLGLATPAQADAVNNLTIIPLVNAVPQSLSNPCIICGTTAGGQPADFGYNNFTSTGNLTSFNTFSTNILGGGPLAGDLQSNALPYSGQLLEAFLNAGGTDPKFTFGVAIDINTASGGETLTNFQLIDLSLPAGQRIIFDFEGSLALPDIRNGNGMGDYLITGFCLSCAGVQPGDNLIFHAAWQGATDGAESFYLVAIPSQQDVPEPGSLWMLGSMLSIGGVAGWWQRRRRYDDTAVAAA